MLISNLPLELQEQLDKIKQGNGLKTNSSAVELAVNKHYFYRNQFMLMQAELENANKRNKELEAALSKVKYRIDLFKEIPAEIEKALNPISK